MRVIHTIDAHTAGEPVRIVTSGVPLLGGAGVREKREDFARRFDQLRAAILHEPRGHRDMFGAVLVPPGYGVDADLGVFFMDSGGYLDMCGHGLIGVVTALLHQGSLEPREDGVVRCDTPAGIVTCRVRERRPLGAVVAFRNVPSFSLLMDEEVTADGVGSVPVDVAYGGNLTAIVDADRLGLELTVPHLPRLTRLAGLIAPAVEERLRELDAWPPGMDRRPALIEFSSRKAGPQADMKNVTVFGDGQVDRSPCGTGTCAKMAVLAAKGQLALQADFRHEGILGTVFRGRLVERTEVHGRPAVIPEVEGESWLTGFHQFVIPEGDPLRSGFLL